MTDIWAYLTREPLLWLTATVVTFVIAKMIYERLGKSALANPSLLAMIQLAAILTLTGTSFDTYFEGAQFVFFLLGPATVCLAVPLYDHFPQIKRTALPIFAGLLAGSFVAVASALGIAWAFGLPDPILASLAPKSATAAVAIGISDENGGLTSLTALFVIMTGLFGAAVATPFMNALGIKDWRARGLAVGVAAHGFGTARALQVHPTAGAFAGLGMGLNALLTAILAPIVLSWFL